MTTAHHLLSNYPSNLPGRQSLKHSTKGLRAFQEVDSEDFFSREAFIYQLIGCLSDSHFLTAFDPSGSGQSSVVKAGLLLALRDGVIHNEAVLGTPAAVKSCWASAANRASLWFSGRPPGNDC